MINIIQYPINSVLKYTCLCSLCGTQWVCDKADIKWMDDFFNGICPICGYRNCYYKYEKEEKWTNFHLKNYNSSYEIPILDRERIEDKQ